MKPITVRAVCNLTGVCSRLVLRGHSAHAWPIPKSSSIARWVGDRLEWNPAEERFKNSDNANGCPDRERRKEYELPEA
jgi:hypothetical protein